MFYKKKGQETSKQFCGYNLHICPMNSQMADSTGPRAFPLSEKLEDKCQQPSKCHRKGSHYQANCAGPKILAFVVLSSSISRGETIAER